MLNNTESNTFATVRLLSVGILNDLKKIDLGLNALYNKQVHTLLITFRGGQRKSRRNKNKKSKKSRRNRRKSTRFF